MRVDANSCDCKSVANFNAKNQLARECKCVQNQAESIGADYGSAALTAELRAPRELTPMTMHDLGPVGIFRYLLELVNRHPALWPLGLLAD